MQKSDSNEVTLDFVTIDNELLVLSQAIPQMVFRFDADGMLNYANPQWFTYSGTNFNQTKGRGWMDIVHADDLASCQQGWDSALTSEKTFEVEARLKRAVDETYRWHLVRALPMRDGKGEVAKWFGTCTDIHDQWQSVNEAKLLAEAIPQLVWTCDHTGEWDYLNQKWVEYTGSPAHSLLGRNWINVLHPDDRESTLNSWLEASKNHHDYDVEMRIRRHDGIYRWFKTRGLAIRDTAGNTVKWFGTCTDIDDQKQASVYLEDIVRLRTEALRIAMDEALRALAIKSQFVANISHEIRTPMSGILGLSELLSQMEITADMREITQAIFQSANNLMAVVNDLLDFSRLDSNSMTLDSTSITVTEAIDAARFAVSATLTRKELILETEVSPRLPSKINCDAKRVRQVLNNLVSNAVKFTDSGVITIKVFPVTTDESKQFARFEVSDTGIGMDSDVQGNLFEPFVQADSSNTRRYGGTGLGLAISRKLIELMGGELGFSSELEKGSTFWFTLPIEPAAPTE